MRLAAVILAGGSGERLGGVVKALIPIGGEPLLSRVARQLAMAETLLVSTGRHDASGWPLPAGAVVLEDLPHALRGPLAGLAAATAWAAVQPRPPEALLLAPVDSPLLPEDLAQRLVEGLGSADAAIASFAGQPYPTSSLWRLATIADLPRAVAAGTAPQSLFRLGRQLAARDVAFPAAPDGGDPFAGVNTPDDLRSLTRRLAST